MIVSLVVAVSRNGVIGKDGGLPWRLPDDLARFKALTMGRAIVMGRVTYESIGRALPGRQNIVISRKPFSAPGCIGAESLTDALARVERRDECFVIGGAQIYAAALPIATRIHLTEVDADVEGDVRFPTFDRSGWRETMREAHAADSRHAHAFAFVTLEKIASQ